MAPRTKNPNPGEVPDRRSHMANERTFLAWIRTSIGIMAFGFVVEKFVLFMRRLSRFFGQTPSHPHAPSSEYSTVFGIVLVAMGALMGLLSFIRYKKVEREINENTYAPSLLLDILVTLGIITIGIFLVFYMIHSLKD